MSTQFIYYPDPGIAFDISKMLIVKLNSLNVWHNLLTLTDFTKTELSHIEEYANALEDPRPELVIFSFVPSNKKVTFLSQIISALLQDGLSNFSLISLKSYFKEHVTVQKDLFNFYFNITLDSSSIDIDHLMQNNKTIPDKIKILLYGFYLYPQKYISKLLYIIEKYYHTIMGNWQSSIDQNIDLERFTMCLTDLSSRNSHIQLHNNTPLVEYSLSFCVPRFLFLNSDAAHPFFITTTTTINKYLSSKSPSPSSHQLMQLSQALSDKTRISILNLLISYSHMSLDELSEKLSLPSSATKYHLSILKEADLIYISQHYRKNMYSFNPHGFEKIHIALDHMQKGGTLR